MNLWWSGNTDPDLRRTVRPRTRHRRSAYPYRDPAARTEAVAVLRSSGDLGYEGDTIAVAFKKPKDVTLTGPRQQFNKARNGIRATGERGNALPKMAPRRHWFSSTSTTAPHDTLHQHLARHGV